MLDTYSDYYDPWDEGAYEDHSEEIHDELQGLRTDLQQLIDKL
jgi:formiminotetrahydrofolate cyclodeaminase